MRILGYGIELKRLTLEDIELVRQYRNSEKIKQYMEYRDHISKEQQLNWFNSVNNINNNYFVIISDKKKVGLIYGANIDWNKKETGNGGIFIWDMNYWNSNTPGTSSFLLTDTSILLGLKRTYIKVLKTNTRAISFNKSLGYELLPGQENIYNQKYVLDIERYKEKRDALVKKIFPHIKNNKVKIIFENDNVINAFYINLINNLPESNKINFEILNHIK